MADDLGDEWWLDGDKTGGQGDIQPDGTFARHNDVFTVFISNFCDCKHIYSQTLGCMNLVQSHIVQKYVGGT